MSSLVAFTGDPTITIASSGTAMTLNAYLGNYSATAASGTVRVEIWLSSTPWNAIGGNSGYEIGTIPLTAGGSALDESGTIFKNNIEVPLDASTAVSNLPAAGRYYGILVVAESTGINPSVDGGYSADTEYTLPNYIVVSSTGALSQGTAITPAAEPVLTASAAVADVANDSLEASVTLSDNATNIGANLVTLRQLEEIGKVTAITVTDSAANVVANLDSLQGLAAVDYAGNSQISSSTIHDVAINLTDSGTPTLTISGAQAANDATALGDISNNYDLVVTGVTLAEEPTVIAESHVTAISIADNSENILNNLATIEKLVIAKELSGITLTDSGTPSISLTAEQWSAYSAVIDAISSKFTLFVAAGSTSTIVGPSGDATTVQIGGAASAYTVTIANGAITVSAPGISDQLSNIAALQFNNLTEIVAETPGGANDVTTGNVTELYSAVLAREPDVAGLAFYQSYLQTNPTTPLQTFAEYFLNSTEYTSKHNYAESTAGDEQFITDSYQNLLHRTPSTAEISFYENNVLAPAVANLTPGTTAYATAQFQAHALMLVYFSASAEFLSDVQITAANPASAQHWLLLV